MTASCTTRLGVVTTGLLDGREGSVCLRLVRQGNRSARRPAGLSPQVVVDRALCPLPISHIPCTASAQLLMPTKVFIQPEGAKHVFRRPGAAFSLDNIVERPERLRAVNCGLAAGLARLEAIQPAVEVEQHEQDQSDDLVRALEGLALGASAAGGSGSSSPAQPTVVFSAPAVGGLIRSKAVEFIHHPPSDDPGEVRYLDSLVSWVKTCEGKWATGESEIPAELPQLDLYRASSTNASPPSRGRQLIRSGCFDPRSLPGFSRSCRGGAVNNN